MSTIDTTTETLVQLLGRLRDPELVFLHPGSPDVWTVGRQWLLEQMKTDHSLLPAAAAQIEGDVIYVQHPEFGRLPFARLQSAVVT